MYTFMIKGAFKSLSPENRAKKKKIQRAEEFREKAREEIKKGIQEAREKAINSITK